LTYFQSVHQTGGTPLPCDLGDLELDCADTGVPGPAAIAVAVCRAVGRSLVGLGADLGTHLAFHERLREDLDAPTQQVGIVLVHVGKESSMTAEATWTFEEVGSGSTRVTQSLNFQMMPGFRPLGRVLEAVFARRLMQRETARMLQDLKRIAEASARRSANA
jgi:hypothetical protein